MANLVTLARTAVEHDFKGDVVDSYAPEMPTRYAKQLTQILRGGLSLGIGRDVMMAVLADALGTASRRCAWPP